MNDTDLKTTVTTPEFRVSYPAVFKPKLNKLNGKMEFSIEALFTTKSDLKALYAAAENACIKMWGSDKTKWPKNIRSPFKKQSEKAKEGKLADGLDANAIFMNFKCDGTKHRPTIVDQNVQEIIEESKFYGGCYAKASVNAFAYPKKGTPGISPGVSFGLNAVQFVRDGEPFSGRPSIEDAFEPIDGGGASNGTADDASGLFSLS